MAGTVSALRVAIARSYALVFGPPLYDVSSVNPAGSPNVLSRMPYRRAVSLASLAKPLMLPAADSAIAYAASLAETIIIEAIASLNGQREPAGIPILMASRPAASELTWIRASGGSRSTATSAVMILAVLAGDSASCTWRPVMIEPVLASTRMKASGGGVPSACAGGSEAPNRPVTRRVRARRPPPRRRARDRAGPAGARIGGKG